MRKLFAFVFLLIVGQSPALANPKIVDFISSVLVEKNLYLVVDGENAPRQLSDGSSLFDFYKKECNPSIKNCEELLLSLSEIKKDQCLRSDGLYAFDELPKKLVNGDVAIFSVSTITDINAKNRDYLNFYHKGVCYEMAWGSKGERFNDLINIANKVVSNL